jgi:hypothetical protein
MPIAAPTPSARDRATAVRATIKKLGPGLTTPTANAPRTARSDNTTCMGLYNIVFNAPCELLKMAAHQLGDFVRSIVYEGMITIRNDV